MNGYIINEMCVRLREVCVYLTGFNNMFHLHFLLLFSACFFLFLLFHSTEDEI